MLVRAVCTRLDRNQFIDLAPPPADEAVPNRTCRPASSVGDWSEVLAADSGQDDSQRAWKHATIRPTVGRTESWQKEGAQ